MTKHPEIIFPNMDGHRSPIENPNSMIVEWSTASVVFDGNASVRALALRISRGEESRMVFLPGDLAKKMAAFIAKEFP